MATEKRLIDANEVLEVICDYCPDDIHCPVGGCAEFQKISRLLTVDTVEVSRLGKLGRLMMPYTGCPRGMFGTQGVSGDDDHKMVIVTELDPIIDVDGNCWVPVLGSDLTNLKAKAQNSVEVVRCRDCKHWQPGDSFGGDSLDDMQRIGRCPIVRFGRREKDFCCEGERKDNDGN